MEGVRGSGEGRLARGWEEVESRERRLGERDTTRHDTTL